MPTNLPPQYFDIEKKLKSAFSDEEKITIIEELLSIIPKHKGTEKLQAMYKSKMAKLRASAQKKKATARHGPSHVIRSSGAGQIVLIGPANAGKSQLLKSLTKAEPVISDYPFSTQTPAPGMMKFENIQIQLIDTPPISEDYMEVWHPELIKSADGVLLVVDQSSEESISTLLSIIQILRDKRIHLVGPGHSCRDERGGFYRKTVLAANKADLPAAVEELDVLRELAQPELQIVPVSAQAGHGLDTLARILFELLNVIRVYSKIPGKKAEMTEPFTLEKGSTVMDMARAVHKDFAEKLRFARIWSQTKYQGQKVNRQYVLEDGDILELHL